MSQRTPLLGLLTLTMSLLAAGPAAAQVKKIDVKRPGVGVKVRKVVLKIRDLAAHRIEMKVLERTSAFGGKVRITGVVKNVGNLAYASRRGQQSAQLYRGRTLVASKAFTSLRPGQECKVSFDMTLSLSNEFPQAWTLVIAFDPDIKIDGNKSNDDMRSANNRMKRTGQDLHAEWNRIERLRRVRESLRRKHLRKPAYTR